jgi:hypothetical protein
MKPSRSLKAYSWRPWFVSSAHPTWERPVGGPGRANIDAVRQWVYRREPETEVKMESSDELLEKRLEKIKKRLLSRSSGPRKALNLYLEGVFRLFCQLKEEDIVKNCKRRMIRLHNLKVRKRTPLFRIIIDITSGSKDKKQKSRWTQALRYARKCHVGSDRGELTKFSEKMAELPAAQPNSQK